MCLEGDDTIQISLVLRPQDGAVNLSVQLLQEVVLAQRLHVICNENGTNQIIVLCFFFSLREIMRN